MAFSGSVARVALLLFKRTQLCAVEAIQNENLVCFTVWLCEACITAFLHLTLSMRVILTIVSRCNIRLGREHEAASRTRSTWNHQLCYQ